MFWNPDPVAFTIPFFQFPIFIYGLCFVSGFFLGYMLLIRLTQFQFNLPKTSSQKIVDQLTWFVVAGTILGARLGHVFFYDWDRYREQPWKILNTREGGLASHGGAMGVLIALGIFYFFFFKRTVKKTFLELLDLIVIPTALVAVFIRIGNFFNQEIIGISTTVPWAVTFGSPAESNLIVPRHPVQLYEAFFYLMTFAVLIYLWKNKAYVKQGLQSGVFFTCVFGSRFLIEFVKETQHSIIDQSFLQTGQLLSLPFILAGLLLILQSTRQTKKISVK